MKAAALLVVIFATNACFGACLPSILNSLLTTGPFVNNVVASGPPAALIPASLLGALLPPGLAPVVPLLNAIFPQGCPATVVNSLLTTNVPVATAATTNGLGLPAALSFLSGQSLNVPASVNLPFGLAGSNLFL